MQPPCPMDLLSDRIDISYHQTQRTITSPLYTDRLQILQLILSLNYGSIDSLIRSVYPRTASMYGTFSVMYSIYSVYSLLANVQQIRYTILNNLYLLELLSITSSLLSLAWDNYQMITIVHVQPLDCCTLYYPLDSGLYPSYPQDKD